MSLKPLQTLEDTVREAKTSFASHFDEEPTLVAAAPGRVNLIGEHIDYCDGFVMPFALPVYTVLAAAPAANATTFHLAAKGFGEVAFPANETLTIADHCWSNYVRGVVQGFRDRGLKVDGGWKIQIASGVPLGAGLSSSAALEVAMATLMEAITGHSLGKKQKALLAQKAEHDFAGVPCGIMDQFASAFGEEGKVVLIDCMSEEARLVPFEREDLAVLISNTKVSHSLNDGGYALRREQTEIAIEAIGKPSYREVDLQNLSAIEGKVDQVVYRRAKHVVGEIARTVDAARALEAGEFSHLGELMGQSHRSLRDDFEVSCKELDILAETAWEIGESGGVIGARMTGGGFGGSTVTLCRAEKAAEIADKLGSVYQDKTGIEADILLVRPSQGAHLVEGLT